MARLIGDELVGGVQEEAEWCDQALWVLSSTLVQLGAGAWCPDHSGALGATSAVPGARGCYLASTRPAPALVMAGEVGPALALLLNARLLLLLVTLVVVEVAVVEGGLSPPDSSRDGTDFRHFPATTDERGEQLKIGAFSYFHFFLLTQSRQTTILMAHHGLGSKAKWTLMIVNTS